VPLGKPPSNLPNSIPKTGASCRHETHAITNSVTRRGLAAAMVFAAPPALAGQDCECVGNGKRIKEGGVVCLQIGSSTTLSRTLRTQSQQHQLEEDRRWLPNRADVTLAGWRKVPGKRLTRSKPGESTPT
jgi:hypothetical protein